MQKLMRGASSHHSLFYRTDSAPAFWRAVNCDCDCDTLRNWQQLPTMLSCSVDCVWGL